MIDLLRGEAPRQQRTGIMAAGLGGADADVAGRAAETGRRDLLRDAVDTHKRPSFTGDLMVFTGSFPEHRIATVLVMASVIVTTGGLLR